MSAASQTRLRTLRQALSTDDLDALVVTELVNIRYLSGFTGTNATLIVTHSQSTLLTDPRYDERARQELDGSSINIQIVAGASELNAIAQLTARCRRIGFEALRITWAHWAQLNDGLAGVELVPTQWLVEKIRCVKDEEELRSIQHAAAIADRALLAVLPMLSEAPTEREVARQLEATMMDMGAHGIAFDTIIAAGLNASRPHHVVSDRSIRSDEMVVFDFGAQIDGYRSDTSRTHCLGSVTPQQEDIHQLVLNAQQAGLAAVKAGVTCGSVHDTVMEVLSEADMAELMTHGLGHGIGLEYHELPWISSQRDHVLREGEVITIEPGIYLQAQLGVRIEDTVVVTAEGCTNFSKAPKQVNPL